MDWLAKNRIAFFDQRRGMSISHIVKVVEIRIDRARQSDKDEYILTAGAPQV
jgi:hypothetical protein